MIVEVCQGDGVLCFVVQGSDKGKKAAPKSGKRLDPFEVRGRASESSRKKRYEQRHPLFWALLIF